jgi:hypothetical protein
MERDIGKIMKGAKIEGFSKCCRLRVAFRVMCPIC